MSAFHSAHPRESGDPSALSAEPGFQADSKFSLGPRFRGDERWM